MQSAFSLQNPILKISDNKDEQLGYMWLFSGAVMAIRNSFAHTINEIEKNEAIEWLYFASALFRQLDKVDR